MNALFFPGFRPVPKTGAIYVMDEAEKLGYTPDSDNWVNFGQGSPQTDPLPNAPDRITSISIDNNALGYSPIEGIPELREAIADLYNKRYRQGKKSQYTRDNVAISSGGRVGLTRVVSTLGRTNIGHFLPDYTAYEELLDTFGTFVPIPILLPPKTNYQFSEAKLRDEINGRGLSALLLSNPCNPTGQLIHGEVLNGWIAAARDLRCTMIFDEFYSHYVYLNGVTSVSAAQYIKNVDEDPIVIIDGVTKNWRYPGFRVSWTLAPKEIIELVASAGSFLDGGCARPMQIAVQALIKQEIADQEAHAIQATFTQKRNTLREGLHSLGISVDCQPDGTFYCWGNLKNLPPPLNTGMNFFINALKENVIVVPGDFFDINPGHRRPDRPNRFQSYARFSFGPSQAKIEQGLEKLARLITAF